MGRVATALVVSKPAFPILQNDTHRWAKSSECPVNTVRD